jgi:hypothetical protein
MTIDERLESIAKRLDTVTALHLELDHRSRNRINKRSHAFAD